MQPSSEIIGIAAHLHVAMRRKLGRVTDTEWMAQNPEYAMAMIALCEHQSDPELHRWAGKLKGMWMDLQLRAALVPAKPKLVETRTEPERSPEPSRAAQQALAQRYVGRLR